MAQDGPKAKADFDPYDALIPIFLETSIPKRLEQIGTAVFLTYDGMPLLFTAAHVTDEMKHGELLVPTTEGLEPIDGYIAYIDLPPAEARANDTIDIAYVRLATPFAYRLLKNFLPLPNDRVMVVQSAEELTVCSVTGYPASKAKKNSDGKRTSEIFSFRGKVAEAAVYEKWGLAPEDSIVLHFHKKRAVYPGTMNPYPTPGLRGVSGGAIFAWPPGKELSDDWNLPRLVGILHTYKEKDGLLIGTTLIPLLAALTLGRMKSFGGVE